VVSVNPYKSMNIYTPEYIKDYKGANCDISFCKAHVCFNADVLVQRRYPLQIVNIFD